MGKSKGVTVNLDEVMDELRSYGSEVTKTTLMKHGAKEPFFGVKVQDLKKVLKKEKKNHVLALELYATGNSDAMYLAALMADASKMSKEDLQRWVKEAYWYYLSEYAVAQLAAETQFGFDLGLEWIESKEENIASSGWSTLANYASLHDDEELDIRQYTSLLQRAETEIHGAQNRVRYCMNGFVIAVGSYIVSLNELAISVGENIGKVDVDMGGTACKVPLAKPYIQKVMDKNRLGKKRKAARC